MNTSSIQRPVVPLPPSALSATGELSALKASELGTSARVDSFSMSGGDAAPLATPSGGQPVLVSGAQLWETNAIATFGTSGVGGPDQNLNAAAQRIDENAASHQIGVPQDMGGGSEAHYWDGVIVRNYSGGPDTQSGSPCMVVDGPWGAKLVRNDFYNHYVGFDNGQPTHIALGTPLDEEHWEDAIGGVVQNFEGGRMLWTPTAGTQMQYFDQRTGQANVGDLVDAVYGSVLGRGRDRWGGEGAAWEGFAQARRNEGRSDMQIMNLLAVEFRKSPEFQSKVGGGSDPGGGGGETFPAPNGLAAIKARYGEAGQNIVTARLPLGPGGAEINVRVNSRVLPKLRETLEDARQQGLLQYIHSFDGMAIEPPRLKRHLDGSLVVPHQYSLHSWGVAFDINYSSGEKNVNPALVNLFRAHGWKWGGDFGDPVHFQYATGY